MKRTNKKFVKSSQVWQFTGLLTVCVLSLAQSVPLRSQTIETVPNSADRGDATSATPEWSPLRLSEPLLREPVWVYNNWSAYDELSDNIPLTETLALKELDELIRLRRYGLHFDYYMMDAFWFAP